MDEDEAAQAAAHDIVIERDLLDAQQRLTVARDVVKEIAAKRSELFAEAVEAGWSIYRIHTTLGLNRLTVQRDLDRRAGRAQAAYETARLERIEPRP